jgi:hypothetical protein
MHAHISSLSATHDFSRGQAHHSPTPRLQSWANPIKSSDFINKIKLPNFIGTIITLILVFSNLHPLSAQDQRSTKTKIADILATLPSTSNPEAERSFAELIRTGEEGINLITEQVQASGQASGIAPRYAVSLLTHYAKKAEDKSLIEKAYLQALAKAKSTETKAYFISNIRLVGSNLSLAPLTSFITDADLFAPAIGALVTIGTTEAKQALTAALPTAPANVQNRLIEALGELKYKPAIASILPFASNKNMGLQKQALWTLALMGENSVSNTLLEKAKAVGFKNDPTEASNALVEYLHQIRQKGNTVLVGTLSKAILAGTLAADQQHFRLAALKSLAWSNVAATAKLLIAEQTRFDDKYRLEILKIASLSLQNPAVKMQWEAAYKKAKGAAQADILAMLAKAQTENAYLEAQLVPALNSSNSAVRMVAADAIARSKNKKFAPAILGYLTKATEEKEIKAAQLALLQLVDKDNTNLLAAKLGTAASAAKIALIQVLSDRRAVNQFDDVAALCKSTDAQVQNAAFQALSNLSSGKKIPDLLNMLFATEKEPEIKSIQSAIVSALDANATSLIADAYQRDKTKVIPILAFMEDKSALEKTKASFTQGTGKEKEAAFAALCNWNNSDAIRTLLGIRQDAASTAYHDRAFSALINQINKSSWSDDDKLAMLQESMLAVSSKQDQSTVIRGMGRLRGLPALMSVNRYQDNPDLSAAASRSVMQIALPTADAKPGLTGSVVRNALERARTTLSGPDSQYERIDIETYLATLPPSSLEVSKPYELTAEETQQGFEILFNSKNLDKWVGNKTDYVVEDNNIAIYPTAAQNRGNLYTAKEFSDFTFRFEFQLTPGANNGLGIHAPLEGDAAYVGKEIQILDNTAPIYAKLEPYQYHGSVYGVIPAKRDFLKPVGEWNQEEVYVVGDFIRVTLNGTVILEGDMNLASKNGTMDHKDHPGLKRNKGHIGFLGHGSVLKFRNIRIKDLSK